MFNQVLRLTKLQLTNLFGINEFRYTKDSGKRRRYVALAAVWLIMIIMVAGYAGGMSYGLVKVGAGKIIPMYVYVASGMLSLIFSFFKAGSILFSMKSYEMIISLPVSKSAIVISRFMSMYVRNVLLAMVITIPAVAVYGVLEMPSAGFYIICLLGIISAPLLPVTVASVIGAAITAISVRTRHKSIVQAVLTVLIVVAFMAMSMFVEENEMTFSEDMLKNIAPMIESQIAKIYPPALWFSRAAYGEWAYIIGFAVLPAAVFVAFVAVLQKHFQSICNRLNAVEAKNNYTIKALHASGVLKALYKRELKRYFSSSIYLANTIVGYMLAVVAMIALAVMGTGSLTKLTGVSGIENYISRALPYGMALLMSMGCTTACAISMEGKTFWQLQTLPVGNKDIYLSKILTNLIVAAPFYAVSVICGCFVVRGDVWNYIWLFIMPALYIVFMAVAGLAINLAFPVMEWDNEVRVVKQSASTFISIVTGIVVSVVPMVGVILAGDMANVVQAVTVVVLVVGMLAVWGSIRKKEIGV